MLQLLLFDIFVSLDEKLIENKQSTNNPCQMEQQQPSTQQQPDTHVSNLTEKIQQTYATGHSATPHSEAINDSTVKRQDVKDVKMPDTIVPLHLNKANNLPVPNKQGTIGSVEMELVHPNELKNLVSRDINKLDTSIMERGIFDELSKVDQETFKNLIELDDVKNMYPWKNTLGFNNKLKNNDVDVVLNKNIKSYILENFYNDLYINIVLMLGTCFFSWALAYCGFSWWSLGFIFLSVSSVYSTEFRRFNRNIRDDIKRITVDENISTRTETTNWLNSFLSKFWIIYMPVLSQQVKDIANPILAGVVPGYGIEALILEEFTLGTKAPSIKGIKSNTKVGKDIVEMDWSFEFTPSDISDMTPIEVAEKINPKISLGVTLGKSFVSKTLSVLVEDINVAGKVRVTLKFGKIFPNIKIVSVSLLEPPLIDFVLKPLGGETLGLDVMSFLPGLKTFVKSTINSVAGPMLYAPNHLDIDVEEIMAAQANDAIGVMAVTIHSANNLVGSAFVTNTVDPYVILKTEKALPGEEREIRTNVKSNVKDPVWNETKYILINSLDQKLTFECFDFNDVRKDELIGSYEFDMTELYQKTVLSNTSTKITLGNKFKGTLNYSISYFPVIVNETKSSTEGPIKTTNNVPEAMENINEFEFVNDNSESDDEAGNDSGILKFTLQKVKYLPTNSMSSRNLSPSASIYLDNQLIKSYRTLKRINEPSWNETYEFLINSKENQKISIVIFDNDSAGKKTLCKYTGYVEDLIDAMDRGQESVKASPQGEIFLVTQWKPVKLTGIFTKKSTVGEPLGSLKINVGELMVKSSLSGFGDIDPYFMVSLNRHVRYKSAVFSDTMNPNFKSTIYVPIISENQFLNINIVDYQNVGSDRKIGQFQLPISEIIEKNKNEDSYVCKSQFTDALKKYTLHNKNNIRTNDTLELGFKFITAKKVFNADELAEVEALEKELQEKKAKFNAKQKEYKELMDENPDDWEIVDVNDPFISDEKKINAKEKMSFDQLISYNTGIITFTISNGILSKSSSYLQILVDSIPYPEFISNKYGGNGSISETNNITIRDLKHSKLLFRVTKKRNPHDYDNLIAEKYISTLDLLKDSYINGVSSIEFQGNKLDIKFVYNPLNIQLPASETVLDTGIIKLNLIGGKNLLSADRNGKSDPFAYVYVDGCKIHKTQVIKKTLDPVWNETTNLSIISLTSNKIIIKVLDWDRAGDNDYLGQVIFNNSEIIPNKLQKWELPLETKGTLQCETFFEPQYIKPDIEFREKGLKDKAPLKAIGAVGGAGANVATSVVGGGAAVVGGVATGSIKAGGSLFKVIGGGLTGSGKKSSSSTANDIGNNESHTMSRMSISSRPSMSSPHSRNRKSISSDGQTINDNGNGNVNHEDQHSHIGGLISSFPRPSINHTSSQSLKSRSSSVLTSGMGKISVLATTNLGKLVQVKVSLLPNLESTDDVVPTTILKTKSSKADSSGNTYYQAETKKFQSGPDGCLLFEAIEIHRLSKDKEIGHAKISLSNPEIKDGEKAAVDIAGGRVIFQVSYKP